MNIEYNEDYFIRGEALGISNYSGYKWLGEPTLAMARSMIALLDIKPEHTVCDIGCARGYAVRAFRELGYQAYGYDTSKWAIENCDPSVMEYVSTKFPVFPFDHFIGKDVMEHVPLGELSAMLSKLLGLVRKDILIIAPLTHSPGGPYVRREDNSDGTHQIRWPLESWMDYITSLAHPDKFIVSGSWHWNGIKPSSATHHKSCGFILIKKI